ncbi:uncharacterized protein N7459_007353 [Penicillium hispanicum]|uniref:uncharacterized protein n=1 Tax=Penicillium hispanicum TaxID=1080232 RepID=UPI00254110DB|nr:uncharacterized protein N7459_007353 [Penicillium hispanicum]KAJ5578389.1 hypothetical protein N7459_007353 [Penicillium hispanicum]
MDLPHSPSIASSNTKLGDQPFWLAKGRHKAKRSKAPGRISYYSLTARITLISRAQPPRMHTKLGDPGTRLPAERIRLANPIPVSGIGSHHLSQEYIQLDMYFAGRQTNGNLLDNDRSKGQRATAKLTIEAHIVQNLKAKLLIGNDVLGPEGFILDFPRAQAIIEACHNVIFPMAIHTKPGFQHQRPVYASERIKVPPFQSIDVPVKVRRQLPCDRDFIFKSTRDRFDIPAILIDAGVDHIIVINPTDKVQLVKKKDKLRHLLEADYTTAYRVSADATALCYKKFPYSFCMTTELGEPETPELPPGNGHDTPATYSCAPAVALQVTSQVSASARTTAGSQIEQAKPTQDVEDTPPEPPPAELQTTLPNGVVVYGTPDVARKLADVVLQYDIWSNPSFVDIPQDQWMRLPIAEAATPTRTQVYRQAPQAEAVIDSTFDELYEQGKMAYATQHVKSCSPVFVVWKYIIDA